MLIKVGIQSIDWDEHVQFSLFRLGFVIPMSFRCVRVFILRSSVVIVIGKNDRRSQESAAVLNTPPSFAAPNPQASISDLGHQTRRHTRGRGIIQEWHQQHSQRAYLAIHRLGSSTTTPHVSATEEIYTTEEKGVVHELARLTDDSPRLTNVDVRHLPAG